MTSIASHIQFAATLANPETGFLTALNSIENHIYSCVLNVHRTIDFDDELQFPYNIIIKNRSFCDAYLTAMDNHEEAINNHIQHSLTEKLADFEVRKSQLKIRDLSSYKEQQIRFETNEAQKELHNTLLNQFPDYSHLPFVAFYTEAKLPTKQRALTILTTTPFPPDFLPISSEAAQGCREFILENNTADDALFAYQPSENPHIERFKQHVLKVKNTILIEPILQKHDLPREPGQLASVKTKLIESVERVDRETLLANCLLDIQAACNTKNIDTLAMDLFKSKSRARSVEKTDSKITENEKNNINKIIDLLKSKTGAKELKSQSADTSKLANKVFEEMTLFFHLLSDLYTLLEVTVEKDDDNIKEHCDALLKYERTKLASSTTKPKHPENDTTPKPHSTKQSSSLCIATPISQSVQAARVKANSFHDENTEELHKIQQKSHFNATRYNYFRNYAEVFKVYLTIFNAWPRKQTAPLSQAFSQLRISKYNAD